MTSQPMVSVVMSAYNDHAHVSRACGSILDQSMRDVELIVVDDGSTDGTTEVLSRLAAADDRVVLLERPNRGLTESLIEACTLARAPLIARQDADDWSHPERLAEQVRMFERDQRLVAVSCATQYVGPADEPLSIVVRDLDPETATSGLRFRREGPPAHGSVMFRAEAYRRAGGYRAPFLYSQDSDLWFRLSELGLFGCVPEVRYFHRKEARSTSGSRRAIQKQFADISHRCKEARARGASEAPLLAEAESLRRRVHGARTMPGEERAAAELNYLLGSQLTRNRDARGRRYLLAALRSNPTHGRAWLRLLQSFLTARMGA